MFDAADKVIWESGRTNLAGVLTDQNSQPIAGELWWKEDCSAPVNSPGNNPHQPHYRTISQQDQVQIFQELVTTPASASAECSRHAEPSDDPVRGVWKSLPWSPCGHHANSPGALRYVVQKNIILFQ